MPRDETQEMLASANLKPLALQAECDRLRAALDKIVDARGFDVNAAHFRHIAIDAIGRERPVVETKSARAAVEFWYDKPVQADIKTFQTKHKDESR